ncbi:hypothetical protein JAAARDRAFT_41403 [Jaapia argillacea MUCL 33604]|uniref:Uncharacterized protein n=1 Tax=Jaapia argillacea MUCL 33604 TaxID=933084 RepID=A0A067PBC8_9AGAM|nr:hypothetical protein JAAARDRAFT_41403 [Jaapia argillacea MUCL 33604]
MQPLEKALQSLFRSLPPRPIDKHTLDSLVEKTLQETQGRSSPETRRAQWEYVIRNEIFKLAATEGQALKDEHTTYYEDLKDLLDIALAFTDRDACEQTFPFSILQDLLEAQTIPSCSHIFTWIEQRSIALTHNLVPQKGKALILLRTLNDLLRRLSKMGTTSTKFCGRILTFLSAVFPLGERSGVNLRGEYGPVWEGPGAELWEADAGVATVTAVKMEVDVKGEVKNEVKSEDDKMQVDDGVDEAKKKKDEFYTTFWSLQYPFSKPPIFTNPPTFASFKEAVNKVLPVIREATTKERAMMGTRATNGPSTTSTSTTPSTSLKRKRESESEPASEDSTTQDYFFAKFLTSPELLDLEIADTHFRRQFLFQLLILLHHLLTFTKASKATWASTRNRSLQMDFTLSDEAPTASPSSTSLPASSQSQAQSQTKPEQTDLAWVQETITKTMEELRQTAPSGRAFAETVNVILERERNWVGWKNELCAAFDKEPWSAEIMDANGKKRKVGLEEATRDVRRKMWEEVKEWDHKLGSGPLTEIWEMGYRDLRDLQNPFQPGEVKDFVKKIKQEDARIEIRRKALAKTAERLAQARAKAGAASKAASPAPSQPPAASSQPTTSDSQESTSTVSTIPASQPQPPSAPRSTISTVPATSPPPLHPSLPPKPNSALADVPTSTSTPAPVPTPAPTPVVAAASQPPPAPAIAAPLARPTPTAPPTPPVSDEQITRHEENKNRHAWLALRTARDTYLQHFGKIGTGDIMLLAQEIEKEKKERESRAAGGTKGYEGMPGSVGVNMGTESEGSFEEKGGSSPMVVFGSGNAGNADGEGDVKMEDR